MTAEIGFWPPEDEIVVIRPTELIVAIRSLVAGLGEHRGPTAPPHRPDIEGE
jgi:hypothetical protein